jgi:hypothetical protein
LAFPQAIPDDTAVYYVSVTDAGWYPAAKGKATGTSLDPIDLPTMQKIIDYAGGPILFLFDPEETFVNSETLANQFFAEPGNTGTCGGTGELCWIFASADLTGAKMPTFYCDGTTGYPTGDGYIDKDDSDTLALVNIRFRCPIVPEENNKPVIYTEGAIYMLNVVSDGLIGTGNTFFEALAGSTTVGINVSGKTQDSHDFDDGCIGLNDPWDCCTATPDCDAGAVGPLFIDIQGGSHTFIGGNFLYTQDADSANVPRVSFAEFSAGTTGFYGTTFRYSYIPQNADTLRYALYVSGTTALTHTHGAVTSDYNTGDDNTSYHFEAGVTDVDLRLFRTTNNGLDRNINAPDMDDGATNTVWGRCVHWDETDVDKNGTCYDVYMVDAGDSLAGTELLIDIQNSVFDDECTTKQFHYDGTDRNEIADFRSDASTEITSYFGTAHHATVGTEGSTDCGGAGDSFCVPNGYRQTATCGGGSIASCQGLCTTSLVETPPVAVPEFFLGSEAGFTQFSFNPNGDQDFGGKP